jgi:hypothetical protein
MRGMTTTLRGGYDKAHSWSVLRSLGCELGKTAH